MTDVVTLSAASLRARTAEEIRAVLGRRRMSESALARAIGASQAYVWRRLSGEIPLDLDDLEKIAAALSVDVATLIPSTTRPHTRVTERYASRPATYPATQVRPGAPRRPARISDPLAA